MATKFSTINNLTATEKNYIIKLLKADLSCNTKSKAPSILAKMGIETKPDMVKGMKAGKIAMYPRAELIEYYRFGVACCEGSERENLMDILEALENGATDVSDM